MLTKKEFEQIEAALNAMKVYDNPSYNDLYKKPPYISLYSILKLLEKYIDNEKIEKEKEDTR